MSIPILNEAGVPQNGLTNTAVGLTTDEPGSEPGEPDKYYPSGDRHYVRIVPKDDIQGAALVTMMKQDGCTKAFMINDKEVFGAGLARNIELIAKEQGLDARSPTRGSTRTPRTTARWRERQGKGADCMVYAGITANNAVQLFKDFSAALPDGKLYGPDGIAESGFADPEEGGIPADVGSKVKVVDRGAAAGESTRRRDSASSRTTRPSTTTASPDPYAIYGYEAMSLTLDAIKRAAAKGEVDRRPSSSSCSRPRTARACSGTYSIDENGDTTLTDYGVLPHRGRSARLRRDDQGRGLVMISGREPIAFIGVGRMGGRMTGGCSTRATRSTVFDPNAEAVAALVERGARAAGSPAEAARGAAFVLCSLPQPGDPPPRRSRAQAACSRAPSRAR